MVSYSIPRISTSTWIVSPSNQSSQHKNNWFLLLIFVLSLLIIIVIAVITRLLADHLLRRRRTTIAGTHHANQSRSISSTGLDTRTIASLPTFIYHLSDKDDDSANQCMVCLSTSKEGEMMKILPNCKHFFHVKCINKWLHSHPTCPICRANVKRSQGKNNGPLLPSGTMPARFGGVRREELSMIKEGNSMLRMGSSSCRKLSMGRRQEQEERVVVDLESGVMC